MVGAQEPTPHLPQVPPLPKSAQTATDTLQDIEYPFADCETWYVYQGYLSAGSHAPGYAFDLVKDNRWDATSSGGLSIYAAATGTFSSSYIGAGLGWGVTIQLADGNAIKNYHLMNVPNIQGTVTKGTKIGEVYDGQPGGVNHLHFQVDNQTNANLALDFGVWHYPVGGPSDGNGQWSGTEIKTPCDTTPPNIAFTPPTKNTWYKTNQAIGFEVSDAESGLDRYEWWWDNDTHTLVEKNGETAAAGTFNLQAAGQGQHTLHLKAWDEAGLSAESSTGWFGYDTVAPALPTSANPGCTATSNIWQNDCNDPNFTWTAATDSGSGTTQYAVYWGTDANGTTAISSSTNPNYNPSTVGSGTHYLRVRAKDKAGNWSNWKTLFTLRYDNVPPGGGFDSNDDALVYALNPPLSVNGADTHSGVAQVELSNDNSIWIAKPFAAQIEWAIPANDEQWQTVYLRLVDQAGNRSAKTSKRLCLDLAPSLPASDGYRLLSGHNAGGGQPASTSYRLKATVGQPFAYQQHTSLNYILQSGFQAMVTTSLGEALFERAGCVAELLGPFTPNIITYEIYLPLVIK